MLDMGRRFTYTVEEKAALDAELFKLGMLEPAKAAVERRRSMRSSKSKTQIKDNTSISKAIFPTFGRISKSGSVKPKTSTRRLSRKASGMLLSEIDQVFAVIKSFEDGNSLILSADVADSSSFGPTPLSKTTMRPLTIKRKRTVTTTLNTSSRPLESPHLRKTSTVKGDRITLSKEKARVEEDVPPATPTKNTEDEVDDTASFTGAEFIGPSVSREEHLSAPPMSFPKPLTSTDAEVPLFRLFRVHQYVRDRRVRDPPMEDKY